MSTEPHPCPFCGSTVAIRGSENGVRFVYCDECGARGPKHILMNFAVISWNNRRQQPDSTEPKENEPCDSSSS